MENNNPNNNNNNCNTSTMLLETNNNNNGLIYPMMMIPSLSHHPHQQQQNHNSHHHQHHNNDNNTNKLCCSLASCSSTAVAAAAAASAGCYDQHVMEFETRQHQLSHNTNNLTSNTTINNSNGSIKAQIMAHPHYPRLLSAFVNCQKVGAPPEVVARLEEVEAMSGGGRGGGGYLGEDPGLDQFMEAYCEMLTKYEQELSKPFKEAMVFLSRIESQFKTLTLSSSSTTNSPSSDLVTVACGEVGERSGSSDEDIDVNNNLIDPSAEDRELKGQLLRKYSGYLGSLRQEFLKKRKKGKLPKEARQQLLDWWSRHYKWPYPSESQKRALAEATGLDQKQINNWFINQRKRHWKPSEDMQFMVMDAATAAATHHPHYSYMETVLGNPFPMDVSQTLM